MLTDADCRNATCTPGKNRHRLTDGAGLYLEVSPTGSKRWFFKYYPDGKEKRLSLGSYPGLTLKAARQARDDARRQRRDGKDPAQARLAKKVQAKATSATTFEAVARELYETKKAEWSESHGNQWLRGLEKDVFPWLGALPLAEITTPMLLATLRKVQARGAVYMAHDLREFCGQVMRYGIATGRCDRNPAADLRGTLKPYTVRHQAAVVEPKKVGQLLRDIDSYQGQPATRAALLLSALTFQRPGNVRAMEWAEIDVEKAMWSIAAAKMKRRKDEKLNGRPHRVPLAPQALAALEEVRPLTGHGRYVFPSLLTGEKCMSENTVNAALRRLGYDNTTMTAHGFRAMARTLIAEQLRGVPADVVEAQLAHGKAGPLGAAYDRADYMEQRRQLMVKWAGYLDHLRRGADVVKMPRRKA